MTGTILVVEDEPLILMDTIAMLETAGLTVVAFDSADDALDFTRTHLSGVAGVFTDVNLRGRMDGIELARSVKAADPSIEVLVTSGRYDSAPEGLPDGVRFLSKPWMPLEVITAMQSAASL